MPWLNFAAGIISLASLVHWSVTARAWLLRGGRMGWRLRLGLRVWYGGMLASAALCLLCLLAGIPWPFPGR